MKPLLIRSNQQDNRTSPSPGEEGERKFNSILLPGHSLLLKQNSRTVSSPGDPLDAAIPSGAKPFIRYTHIQAQACCEHMSPR